MTGDIHTVLLHVRDKNVSPYAVFGVKDLGTIIEMVCNSHKNNFLQKLNQKSSLKLQRTSEIYRKKYLIKY